MPIEPGQQLLHYRIVDKLGEGGMGVVWRATDTTLDRDVAIKVLPQAFAADADRVARFEREARLLASLNHPNVAGIYGIHEADGVRFLAMELVPGLTLREWLRTKPSYRDKLRVFVATGEGLAAAHRAGLVHRDFKPANVILGEDGRPRVLDFGVTNEQAWEVGLACGGKVQVFVERIE